MVLRWIAADVQEAARGFRCLIRSCRMPTLTAALHDHDAGLDGTLASQKEAA
jgi:hypothetical protein